MDLLLLYFPELSVLVEQAERTGWLILSDFWG